MGSKSLLLLVVWLFVTTSACADVVTLATGAMWGAMALAVGIITGGAVRLAGRGVSRWFGVVAAVWALIGCAAGNAAAVAFLRGPAMDPPHTGWWLLTHLSRLGPELEAALPWWHLVFYVVAAIEGYWLAFERVRAPQAAR